MQWRPHDYVRLNFNHPSLDSDIWFEFTQSQSLDEELILNNVQAVEQSKKHFTLTAMVPQNWNCFTYNITMQMKHLQANIEIF